MLRNKIFAFAGIAVIGLSMTGCATNEERMAQAKRMDMLEKKVNMALSDSAAAKIDANTALHIAVENQQKLK